MERGVCKRCKAQYNKYRYIKQRIKNVALYGTVCSPRRLEVINQQTKERLADQRTQAMVLLNSRCQCCGEDRLEILTFDHIYGGGRTSGMNTFQVVREILVMKSPESKYRVLCWNCNFSLGAYGYCPHNGRPPEEEPANRILEQAKYRRQLYKKHKLEFISGYNEKCVICGESCWEFLTVDHINGGGKQHRRELGGRQAKFYLWLKNQGYPKDRYQLLCFNCNCGLKGKLEKGKLERGNYS